MKRGVGFIGGKSGQVTIFIIIAIIIVAVVVGFFFISPRLGTSDSGASFNEENPRGFMQNCLGDNFKETVELISLHGGSVEPTNYVLYEDNFVNYLCYTSEDYTTCVVQQPLLKRHVESDIKGAMTTKVNECFSSLQENYENENYNVVLTPGDVSAELLPNKITLSMSHVLTATKGSTQRVEDFSIVLNNNLYELLGIANSIVDWESTYGDSETTIYTSSYRQFKVEKKYGANESKIYILTDINTLDKFQFASRSLPLPSDYGEVAIF